MPDKTERILSYLPGTFRPSAQLSALRAIVDAFGTELLSAENSLAAIMQAHWVGHADRGAKTIDDLACLAALYGLAPRDDEGIEEFRQHLLHYIKTFLEGSVTVQGILRISAEALGIKIDDAYEGMDAWWNRKSDELITAYPDEDDAAELLFDLKAIKVSGSPARSARVKGTIDLSKGADLRRASKLRLKIDNSNPVDVDLADKDDLSSVDLGRIKSRIQNSNIGVTVLDDGPYLTLESATVGPESRLEVLDVEEDAAGRVLGLAPRVYNGSDESPADVIGTPDLQGNINLSDNRYLRLIIDGKYLAEIDCAGTDPAHTNLDQIRDAINRALYDAIQSDLGISYNVASHDGHHIRLTSPTKGFSSSSIAFQSPAAQDATAILFGSVQFYAGKNPQPARLTGTRDLSRGVDLSIDSNLQLNINGTSRIVNCAGEDPAHTNLDEMVAAVNGVFTSRPASHDGSFLTLTSPTTGSTSQIILETPKERDATEVIFGISLRIFQGTAARGASIISEQDFSYDLDLRARHLLNLAVDGGTTVQINLRAGALDYGAVSLQNVVDNIDKAIGTNFNVKVASTDGKHLILESPTTGSNSSLVIEPLEIIQCRRFVTRATIVDEAVQAVFGFIQKDASGEPATSALVKGNVDLSGGVDLTTASYLRISVDSRPALDIDCAGPRPRATTIDDVMRAINGAKGTGPNVATKDKDGHLILTSPTAGENSQIAFDQPRPTDALDKLLGIGPGIFNGQDATGVAFVSTVDLSGGINLEDHAFVKIGVDEVPSVEIDLGGSKNISDIIEKIRKDLILLQASTDSKTITLTSPSTGSKSKITFDVPSGKDVTKIIFGIDPPRSYHGQDPTEARIVGVRDLTGKIDLSTARFLRLTVDETSEDIDCAFQLQNPSEVLLQDIVKAINANPTLATLGGNIASGDGVHLILTSIRSGASSHILVDYRTSEDARNLLLGDVDDIIKGTDAKPAVITGKIDLLGPVDLSQRNLIRLAVDGDWPLDIDVSSRASPKSTSLDDIETAINKAFKSSIAGHTDDSRITITSPTAGESSNLSILPLRHLDVVEYSPIKRTGPDDAPRSVVNSDSWQINNNSVANVYARICLKAPQGAAGPALVNVSLGWQIRLLTLLKTGDTAWLSNHPEKGLVAKIESQDGTSRSISGGNILVGPIGSQVWVPFEGYHPLTVCNEGTIELQLNNPLAPRLIRLYSRSPVDGFDIIVSVTEADLAAISLGLAKDDGEIVRKVGRIQADGKDYCLANAEKKPIANLKAGPGINLKEHINRAVAVTGPFYKKEGMLMVVQDIADLFDVFIKKSDETAEEQYCGVTIGLSSDCMSLDPGSFFWKVNVNSKLVKAEELDKGTVLALPRGISDWRYLECLNARFNQAKFDKACFAGGRCCELGIFDISRFGPKPPMPVTLEPVVSVFASSDETRSDEPRNHSTVMNFYWDSYQPGTFTVNLPADLPERFGGRFNEARFGRGPGDFEDTFSRAVTEPKTDPAYLVNLINGSSLVVAKHVDSVPQGWSAVTMPFSELQFLTLGNASSPACIFLAEKEHQGFISLCAKHGISGNDVAVTARSSGTAKYDIEVTYKIDSSKNGTFSGAVTGPETDPAYLVKLINGSSLVVANKVDRVPLGWSAVTMPFREPQFLTLGSASSHASIFLTEEGLQGFIQLYARDPGLWGNEIAVTAKSSGEPARYDVDISYKGAIFETARQIVLGLSSGDQKLKSCNKKGGSSSSVQTDLQKPSAVGIFQAKAAGIYAEASRERSYQG